MPHDARPTPVPGGTYPLGGREVARIGYGAMQLRHADPARAVALLRRAVDLGVDHIDTAQFYGDGFVNDVIRRALRPGDDVLVASKVGAEPDPRGKIPLKLAQRPEQIRASVEANLASLGVEQIPLVNLRRADVGPGLTAEGDQVVDIDDQMAVMIAMRQEGKVGAIGLSAPFPPGSPASRTPTASSAAAARACSGSASPTGSPGCPSFRSAAGCRVGPRSPTSRRWSRSRRG